MTRPLEAERQQQLLRALWRDDAPDTLDRWLRGPMAARRRGLQAYQANAGALAERALSAALPTVAALVGGDAMSALARAHWHRRPPRDGDIARWGDQLADDIASDPQLAELPYLADVARLDWAVHLAGQAADDHAAPAGLERLAGDEPERLRLRLRAGHAVLSSSWPLHTLWTAHRADGAATLDDARDALTGERAEPVRVRREGLRVVVDPIDAATAGFESALLRLEPLSSAWQSAGEGFDFEAWFLSTLRHGGLAAVEPIGDHP